MAEPIAEHEIVVSLINVEAEVVDENKRRLFKAGTAGTVVLVHTVVNSEPAYEVEFPLTAGRGALATLRASEVRKAPSDYHRACPCCGCKTLGDLCPGSWEVCPVCFWEDDPVQWEDPSVAGGANRVSLAEARKNFVAFGACDRSALVHVRPPTPAEQANVEEGSHGVDD